MSTYEPGWHRTKEGLERALKEYKSFAAAGRALGIAASTLRDAGSRLGVESPGKLNSPSNRAPVIPSAGAEDPIRRAEADRIVRRENDALKKQIRTLTEGDDAQEALMRRVEKAIADASPQFERTAFRPSPQGERTPQEGVLLYSDNHASEVVSLRETRGINEYSWDIMLDRMNAMVDAVLSHTQHFGFNISTLNIYGLGDHLSGDIHEELAITNDRPMAEAVVQLAYDTVPWLQAFAGEFEHIHVATVPGNHPRATKKPAAKMAHNNGDWLYWKMVEALLKDDPQFSFDIPVGSFNVQMIADRYRALLMHGDGIRSTMPGVPWGGISRRITTLETQFNSSRQPLDVVYLGHFHSKNALDGVQASTHMNGSIKGVDEYSLKQFGSGRPASQTLHTYHPKRGLTGSYAIELQGRQPASEGW